MTGEPPLVILAGHADAARGVLSAAEMIVGAQPRVHAVGLAPEQDPAAVVEEVRALAAPALARGAEVLLLVDLLGGSPMNALAAAFVREPGVQIVGGLNLPMVLEVLMRGLDDDDLAGVAVRAGRDGIADAGRRIRDAASIA